MCYFWLLVRVTLLHFRKISRYLQEKQVFFSGNVQAVNNHQKLPGADPALPKTYKSNFFHHNFVQFGKQHSRLKANLSSTVLPQQCCELQWVLHHSYSSEAIVGLHYQILAYWNRPPNFTDWIRSWKLQQSVYRPETSLLSEELVLTWC